MRVRLREVRLGKVMTQADLAEASGIAEANISRIENGAQRPRISTIRKLAQALGVPPETLVILEPEDRELPEMGKAAA